MSESSVHPEARALIRAAAQAPRPRLLNLSIVDARRLSLGSIKALDMNTAAIGAVEDTVISGETADIAVRVYRPPALAAFDTLLFFHGGGWTVGSVDSHDDLCRTLCGELGLRVVSVEYRLAPEHVFPAAHDDAAAAAAWLTNSPSILGESVSGVLLAGDSAGGNLAAGLAARWAHRVPVRAQLLLYPVLDVSSRAASYDLFRAGFLLEADDMERFIAGYAPDPATRVDPLLSPLRGSLAGLPPTIIVAAGTDVLRDEGRNYARKLIEAGVETYFIEAKGFPHAWATSRRALPSSKVFLDAALSTLRAIVARFAMGGRP